MAAVDCGVTDRQKNLIALDGSVNVLKIISGELVSCADVPSAQLPSLPPMIGSAMLMRCL